MSNKLSLEDIFNDPVFQSLAYSPKTVCLKSDDDRLVESFEEINAFVDKHQREPSPGSMSEYALVSKLKSFREHEAQKISLKPYDRHNLLADVPAPAPSLADILADDFFKDMAAQEAEALRIFDFKHTPTPESRAEADFVAQRQPIKDEDFEHYQQLFDQVHAELKTGQRKLLPFTKLEKNLHVGDFYLMDGLLLYLESADLMPEERQQKSAKRMRLDGRTKTIFENGTSSDMLYRSLGRQLQKNGKMITATAASINQDLFVKGGVLHNNDKVSGYIYVLQSKSAHPAIQAIPNLYKIGLASQSVDDRIKNAKNEATYLFAEVHKVATYQLYNRDAATLELLLHRFFAQACLNVDIELGAGQRITPREWFVLPLPLIEQAIALILNEDIMAYRYDHDLQDIVPK